MTALGWTRPPLPLVVKLSTLDDGRVTLRDGISPHRTPRQPLTDKGWQDGDRCVLVHEVDFGRMEMALRTHGEVV